MFRMTSINTDIGQVLVEPLAAVGPANELIHAPGSAVAVTPIPTRCLGPDMRTPGEGENYFRSAAADLPVNPDITWSTKMGQPPCVIAAQSSPASIGGHPSWS